MDPDLLNVALHRFATDLTLAGEPTVFDAVVERHLDLLLDLQASGLRWPSVLKLLKQAGAQRLDGADLSPDQFRASISRAKRRRVAQTSRPIVSLSQQASEAGRNRPRHIPESARQTKEPGTHQRAVLPPQATSPAVLSTEHKRDLHDPDLSEADLDAVRRRLR